MRLEDEIQQPLFKSEYRKLVVNLVFTGSWINVKTSEMLKPFKITVQQFNILRILRGQHPKPATVNMLIDRMLDKMSNVSRIIDKLERKQLVVRKICPDDRRCVDVLITEKGLRLLKKIDLLEKEWEGHFTGLSVKEAKDVNRMLDKLRT